jgi:NADH-quinone oxidoreductase subunit H
MNLGWRILIPAALGWFILLAAQRVGSSAGWDQTVVTTSTALVLIVGYLLLQAAHKISRDNREKDGASF